MLRQFMAPKSLGAAVVSVKARTVGPDSIRADYETIVTGRAIGEPDRDVMIVLLQRCERRAASAAQIGDTRQQGALQFGPLNPDAGTCIAPQCLEIGFRQHVTLRVSDDSKLTSLSFGTFALPKNSSPAELSP
jgi:hypothetical protein